MYYEIRKLKIVNFSKLGEKVKFFLKRPIKKFDVHTRMCVRAFFFFVKKIVVPEPRMRKEGKIKSKKKKRNTFRSVARHLLAPFFGSIFILRSWRGVYQKIQVIFTFSNFECIPLFSPSHSLLFLLAPFFFNNFFLFFKNNRNVNL